MISPIAVSKLVQILLKLIPVIAGVVAISIGIGVPPEQKLLFSGATFMVGILIWRILVHFTDRTGMVSPFRSIRFAVALCGLAVILIVIYIALFRLCVVSHSTHGTIYYPLWTAGRLAELIENKGGRYELLDAYGNRTVNNEIRAMPGAPLPLIITTITFLLAYQAIIVSIAFAYIILIPAKGETESVQPESMTVKQNNQVIKVLFLAANPSDSDSLRLDRELRTIDERIRLADFRDRFDLRQHWAVRVIDLQSHLLRHKPNIVHFSGHGSVSSEIILENDQGDSHPVSSRALTRLFSILKKDVKCVVLNACYSEEQAKAISKHVKCVIGMSKAISDEAALSFSAAFYQALGYGKDIKTAFDLACDQIDLQNLNEQDTPKLLTSVEHSENTSLFGDE